TGSSLYSALRRTSALPSDTLIHAISEYHGVPIVKDQQWLRHQFAIDNISHAFLRENKVFPLGEADGGILLAMEDPSDSHTINAVRIALDRQIIPRVAAAEDIQSAIERAARDRGGATVWQDAKSESASGDDVEH